MVRASRRRIAGLIGLAAGALTLAFPAIASAVRLSPTKTPFYAIERDYVPVPKGVMPWGASWSPDGTHILFENYHHPGEWLANADGSDVHCLTCAWHDNPNIVGGFSYVFPGNKRMLLANELGNTVDVLECSPNLYRCRSHRWVPVDLSGDVTPSEPDLGRRTYHLAPDGIHLAYTIIRPDGLVMMIAKLQREKTDYTLVDYRVVNPSGPSSPTDTDPTGWANGGSLDELKSFADGGRDIIILAEPNGIPEEEEVNLASGKVTQLTGYDDWTEDGEISPDDGLLLSESWRTEHRLTTLGLMPLNQPFLQLADPEFSIYYVSSPQGFACDLQPWLLPASGDQDGTLVGQPLNPYGGGTSIPGNNLDGQQVWSPDSTRVLLQGRLLKAAPKGSNFYEVQKGPAPSELIIAHIRRAPTKPIKPVTTVVGSWAPTPQAYRSSFDMPGAHTVAGRRAGTAVITIAGNLAGGSFSVAYHNYSNDGKAFLTGTEMVNGSVESTTSTVFDLRASNTAGSQIGYLTGTLGLSQITPAPPATEPGVSMSQSLSSAWMGKTSSGLPKVGACPATLPRKSRLILDHTVSIKDGVATVTARVISDIYSDTRPVQGATVAAGRYHATTNRVGIVTLHIPLHGRGSNPDRLTASAGNTFITTQARLSP